MTKKLVMVDVLSQFRLRYVFEVEDDIDHALDEYVSKAHTLELKEFSQTHLEPTVIIDHREITKDDYFDIWEKDNDYLKEWDEEKKLSYINVIDYEK
jgi:hypothetical protein